VTGVLIGEVIWFNPAKGYGFIRADDGRDVFWHTAEKNGHQTIHPGMRVSFETVDSLGSLLAVEVQKV